MLLFTTCNPKTTGLIESSETVGTKGSCTLEPLEWNTITEGFDQEKTLKILTELQVASKLNSNKILGEGKVSTDFETAFNNIIKFGNQKTFYISDEVQNLAYTLKNLVCTMQTGFFKGNEKAAQQKYLELLDEVSFAKKKLTP